MNWAEICNWLVIHGHISMKWETIEVSDDGLYCSDTYENTYISVFTKGSGELVVFIGCFNPRISVGGNTSVYVETDCEVMDYLRDNMDRLYDELMGKAMEKNG